MNPKPIKKQKGLLTPETFAGVNQLLPMYYPWAWEKYKTGSANHWSPTDVSMMEDKKQWNTPGVLSDDEKLVVKRCMGFFAGSESLVGNNLLLSIFKHVTAPEVRQYLLRQAVEEAIHNETVVYVCESLGLEIDEIYGAYMNIPSIKAKDDFLMQITEDINRPDFTLATLEGKRQLARTLITYYILCEGIMFYSGFAMLLSFGRQNKLKGISEQIQYTLRDEGVHVAFGTQLLKTFREEHPEVFSDEFLLETVEHIKKAVALEEAYAHDVLPSGILGLNATMLGDYVRFQANRRLEELDLPFQYDGAKKNPFPWLSETIEAQKKSNFFESRVTTYSKASSLEDDL